MKKYKLIKKYPGSPELGLIIKKNGTCYESDVFNVHFHTMDQKNIENNPEFWEEVDEIYHVGTRVKNLETQTELIRKEDGWYKEDKTAYTDKIIRQNKGKRFQIIEESKKDYPLYFCDLKNNEYYTTEYPEQGLYTFKQGYNLWINHGDNTIHNLYGDFTPENGFHNFRKATQKEIQMLVLEPEKEKEEEYKILSFISDKNSHRSCNKVVLNEQTNSYDWDLESCKGLSKDKVDDFLKNKNWKIHSIRRSSDGEIFTINDTVQLIPGKWDSNDCNISEIKIINDNVVFGIIQGTSTSEYDQGINSWRKITPRILFTTEDNVDIKENDNYWCVDRQYDIYTWKAYRSSDNFRSFKRFSTKEAAEEYVLMNKPCLSINEVIDITWINKQSISCDELKQLVKSKL